MNLTIEQKTQMYCDRMQQIVYRLQFVNWLISNYENSVNLPASVESKFLQLRLVLELIATASLIMNNDAVKDTGFRKKWHAGEILKAVEKVNPQFYYPIPLRRVETPTTNPLVGDSVEEIHEFFKPFDGDYLNREQFTTLYVRCGKILHISNPFDDKSFNLNLETCNKHVNESKKWQMRIQNLLLNHLFKLHGCDDTIYLAYVHADGKKIEFHLATVASID